MRVLVARMGGFCMGVKRAVHIALQTVDTHVPPVYTCGPLIHNPQVIEDLRAHGIEPINDWRTIKRGTLIIRAHGIPIHEIDQMRSHGLQVVDATCPHVVASQKQIHKHYTMGDSIIILGDRDHPEILSLQSFAPDRHIVISTRAEALAIQPVNRCLIVAQTTFHEKDYRAIAGILKKRIEACRIIPSICRATSQRQEEVVRLARKANAVVVVGGKASANTRRLAEIAAAQGARAFPVETADDLEIDTLLGMEAIAVTAGASTPDWVTQRVIERLRALP